MRSFALLAVLAGTALAVPKPGVDCVTKGNTVVEYYDVTVTEVVYVTEGAAPAAPTYVPASTTKRRKHKHKAKPTTTPVAVYSPPPPPADYNNNVVTITVGAGGSQEPPPSYDQPAAPTTYEAPPPPTYEAPSPPKEDTPPPPPKEVSNSPAPSTKKPSSGSSPADFVAIHNYYRAKFGSPPVTWDDTLAAYAQSKTPCQMVHTGGPYGENLAMRGPSIDATFGVDMWVTGDDEYSGFDYSNPNGGGYSHFSQVVWKGTEKIGCHIKQCGNGQYMMCEYEPAGNMMGAFAENVPQLLPGVSLY